MRRLITHHELTRDRRFIRQNLLADLMASLPDDVDAVVQAFDAIAPAIEASVRATPFAEVFDAYGPGFLLTILNEPLDPHDPFAALRLKVRMHGTSWASSRRSKAPGGRSGTSRTRPGRLR